MKAINLYFLSRVREESMFSDYENYLTRRDEYKRSRKAEQESVCSMVDQLLSCSCLITYKACDGFFFSYVIDHISKEFDLVKVAEDKSKVLNIELKSMDIGTERIAAQLRQLRADLTDLQNALLIHGFTIGCAAGHEIASFP